METEKKLTELLKEYSEEEFVIVIPIEEEEVSDDGREPEET